MDWIPKTARPCTGSFIYVTSYFPPQSYGGGIIVPILQIRKHNLWRIEYPAWVSGKARMGTRAVRTQIPCFSSLPDQNSPRAASQEQEHENKGLNSTDSAARPPGHLTRSSPPMGLASSS